MQCGIEGSAQKRCTVISEKKDSVKKGKNDCHDDFQNMLRKIMKKNNE